MPRRDFSPKIKTDAWNRSLGRCEECTAELLVGKINYDHVIPDQLGGEPTLENCAVLCKSCHGLKTSMADVPRIAKAKRNERKHFGIREPSRWPKRRFGT